MEMDGLVTHLVTQTIWYFFDPMLNGNWSLKIFFSQKLDTVKKKEISFWKQSLLKDCIRHVFPQRSQLFWKKTSVSKVYLKTKVFFICIKCKASHPYDSNAKSLVVFLERLLL